MASPFSTTRAQRFLRSNIQYTYGRLTGCVRSLIMGSMYFQIGYKEVCIDFTSTINLDASYLDRTCHSKQRYSPPWNRQDGILERKMSSNVSSNILSNIIGHGWDSILLVYNTCRCSDWEWYGRYWNSSAIHFYNLRNLFWNDDHLPITSATLAASILTSLWVSACRVVVVLSDLKFYQWMFWRNPFQCAMNPLTSNQFLSHKRCRSDCRCPQFPDKIQWVE